MFDLACLIAGWKHLFHKFIINIWYNLRLLLGTKAFLTQSQTHFDIGVNTDMKTMTNTIFLTSFIGGQVLFYWVLHFYRHGIWHTLYTDRSFDKYFTPKYSVGYIFVLPQTSCESKKNKIPFVFYPNCLLCTHIYISFPKQNLIGQKSA